MKAPIYQKTVSPELPTVRVPTDVPKARAVETYPILNYDGIAKSRSYEARGRFFGNGLIRLGAILQDVQDKQDRSQALEAANDFKDWLNNDLNNETTGKLRTQGQSVIGLANAGRKEYATIRETFIKNLKNRQQRVYFDQYTDGAVRSALTQLMNHEYRGTEEYNKMQFNRTIDNLLTPVSANAYDDRAFQTALENCGAAIASQYGKYGPDYVREQSRAIANRAVLMRIDSTLDDNPLYARKLFNKYGRATLDSATYVKYANKIQDATNIYQEQATADSIFQKARGNQRYALNYIKNNYSGKDRDHLTTRVNSLFFAYYKIQAQDLKLLHQMQDENADKMRYVMISKQGIMTDSNGNKVGITPEYLEKERQLGHISQADATRLYTLYMNLSEREQNKALRNQSRLQNSEADKQLYAITATDGTILYDDGSEKHITRDTIETDRKNGLLNDSDAARLTKALTAKETQQKNSEFRNQSQEQSSYASMVRDAVVRNYGRMYNTDGSLTIISPATIQRMYEQGKINEDDARQIYTTLRSELAKDYTDVNAAQAARDNGQDYNNLSSEEQDAYRYSVMNTSPEQRDLTTKELIGRAFNGTLETKDITNAYNYALISTKTKDDLNSFLITMGKSKGIANQLVKQVGKDISGKITLSPEETANYYSQAMRIINNTDLDDPKSIEQSKADLTDVAKNIITHGGQDSTKRDFGLFTWTTDTGDVLEAATDTITGVMNNLKQTAGQLRADFGLIAEPTDDFMDRLKQKNAGEKPADTGTEVTINLPQTNTEQNNIVDGLDSLFPTN